MRLFYHPESDSLFWDEFTDDALCEDVTDDARFQDAAAKRGIKCPGKITPAVVPEKLSGGLAGAIQESYKRWDRKPSDFYPTPYEGTESLMPIIKTAFPDGAALWDPCCGDMDMVRVLEWHGFEVTSTDIRDTGQGIGEIDFLNDDVTTKLGWEPRPDMIVMNPPFSMAAEFIEKALSYTPNVACLMKIDYWNAVSRLPLWRARQPAFFFPLTFRLAFLKDERGNSPLMNCAWAVWLDDKFRDLGKDVCVMEPMPKIAYPGYNGTGIRKGLAKLGQALDELTEAIRGSANT
ncbi:MAG TPA: hypothetical protein VK181_00805 [Rhizobium sp.]|nr:hypothetical protein [Rhizobium sp.]